MSIILIFRSVFVSMRDGWMDVCKVYNTYNVYKVFINGSIVLFGIFFFIT